MDKNWMVLLQQQNQLSKMMETNRPADTAIRPCANRTGGKVDCG